MTRLGHIDPRRVIGGIERPFGGKSVENSAFGIGLTAQNGSDGSASLLLHSNGIGQRTNLYRRCDAATSEKFRRIKPHGDPIVPSGQMFRPAKSIERCGTMRIDDLAGIGIPLGSDRSKRIEQRPVKPQRSLRIGRNDLDGHAATQHPSGSLTVSTGIGPLGTLGTVVVPNDTLDTVGKFGMRLQQVAPVRQSTERYDRYPLGFMGKSMRQEIGGSRISIGHSIRIAPIDPRRTGPPRRRLRTSRTAAPDRNALVVESMQQRSNTTGCLSRRQSAVGRDNGQHFGLTVAQKHTQRPQIVRSPGMYYGDTVDKADIHSYTATVIPYRGACRYR